MTFLALELHENIDFNNSRKLNNLCDTLPNIIIRILLGLPENYVMKR